MTWLQDITLSSIPISSVIVDAKNNIYCGTGYYDSGNGVFYSDAGGQLWTQIGLAGKVVLSLAFDSEGSLFAGTLEDGLYKTSDVGQNWYRYQKGIYKKEVYRLKINKQDDIFIGSEGGGNGWYFYGGGGVFKSTNGGDSFEQVGLPISLVKNMVFSGDSLIITATPSGVQEYNRNTQKWRNLGLHNVEAITITPSDYLYAATRDDGLFKSTNRGESWLLTNLTADTLMPVFNVLANNDDTLFASTGYLMNLRRSTNRGEDWIVLPITTGESARELFFNSGNLYASGLDYATTILYKSTDYGLSFDSLYSGFETLDLISSLSVINNGFIFIASRDDSLNGLFRSTDIGLTWQKILEKNLSPVVFANNGGLVITSSDSVNLSYDYGITWKAAPQQIGNNLGDYITEIKQDRTNKFLFGTSTKGLYEVDLVTNIEEETSICHDFYLSQNYPNPFNPMTNIQFEIPDLEKVTLKIYDILGREISTLINEEKKTGIYRIKFDGTDLPSGIYFYQLKAGMFTQTKKMILLK